MEGENCPVTPEERKCYTTSDKEIAEHALKHGCGVAYIGTAPLDGVSIVDNSEEAAELFNSNIETHLEVQTTLKVWRDIQLLLRTASKPDHEIDCLIQAELEDRDVFEQGSRILAESRTGCKDVCVVGFIDPTPRTRNFTPVSNRIPKYTEDLSAIRKLVEEQRGEAEWNVDSYGNASVHGKWPQADIRGPREPAIALTLAWVGTRIKELEATPDEGS